MAYAFWPNDLPPPLLGGMDIEAGAALYRTQPDRGPALQRSLTDAMPSPTGASFLLSVAQWNQLLAFFRETLVLGALPFQWVDPLDNATVKTMRFTAGPRAKAHAQHPGYVEASCPLEELP